MDSIKPIVAEHLDSIIEQVSHDLASGISLHDYHLISQLGKHFIKLDVSSSPGGGEEGGYGFTSINTALLSESDFKFVLYPEDFIIAIGKFFGVQDIVLGYPEFDDNVVVKTNDAARLKAVLGGVGARKILQNLSGFSLKLESDHHDGHMLHLSIQRALTDINELNQVLAMYYEVLMGIEAGVPASVTL